MYTFHDIIGNEQLIKSLQSAVSAGKVSHAYIFSGERGMGKKLIANTFAKTLQCLERGAEPCGQCKSCRSFDSHNHPDVIYVSAKKTKSLGVDDIREQIIHQVDLKQFEYAYKIFIIDHADEMTQAAQNALLKTLEEPPYYAVFLLLAENLEQFLPTILSRCVHLKLRPLPNHLIEQYLYEQGFVQKQEAGVFSEYAQGNLGRAIEISTSEEFIQMRQDVLDKLSKIPMMDMVGVMAMAKELEIYKDNLQFLDFIDLWFHDLFAAKACKDKKYIIQKDKEDVIFRMANKESHEGLGRKCRAIWEAKRQLSQNANFQLTLEILLMKLKES